MNDIVRFPANVPYPKWPEAYAFYAAAIAGEWGLAKQLLASSTRTASGTYITDSIGAIQKGYTDFDPTPPPVTTIELRPPYDPATESHGRDFTLQPGPGVSIESPGPGTVTIRVPDGVHVFVSYSTKPGEYVEGSASHGSGTALVQMPAGTYWVNARLGEEMTKAEPANILVQPT